MSTGVDFTKILENECKNICISIRHQMASRAYRASNELRNASQLVLRGQRSGRQYNVPGTGRMKYYKKDSDPVGLVYHRRNSKNHKAGTASLIYKHKAGTATITYKKYTASAPGEPPAVRTGAFRMSWMPKTNIETAGNTSDFCVVSSVESTQRTDKGKHLLGEILEYGTSRMAPRPHHERIQEKALPQIMKIYNEPYF